MVAEQWPLERAACRGPGPDGGRGIHASFSAGASAAEGPAVTAADREDVLGRILAASSASAALLGPDEAPRACPAMGPAESLERYRRLIRLAHPDRCTDRRAAPAFLRASCAFDSLCAVEAGQPAYFEREGAADAPAGSRWWSSCAAEELDRLLEHRVAVLQALQAWADGLPTAGVRPAVDQLCARCADAARACEHLDRRSGIGRHRLWLRVTPTAASPQQSASLLADLVVHLRAVHRFCALRQLAFAHPAELEAACPTSAVNDAICVALAPTPRSAEVVALRSGMQEQEDADAIDPLDAYMEIVMGEVEALSQPSAGEGVEASPSLQRNSGVVPAAPVVMSAAAVPFAAPPPCSALACNGQQMAPTRIASQAKVSEVRLATGCVVPLATGTLASPKPGLQEDLLGDMDSDGSELDI